MVSLFDDMSQISEAEVKRMLPLVDEQRRNEALRYKFLFGQFACLKSWLMLKDLHEFDIWVARYGSAPEYIKAFRASNGR